VPWDHLFWLAGAVFGTVFGLLLAAGSLVSMLRSDGCSRRTKALWAAAIVLLPILGPVLWLAVACGRTAGMPAPDADGDAPAVLQHHASN